MRRESLPFLSAVAALAAASSCITDICPISSAEPMIAFSSDAEFERYMEKLARRSASRDSWWGIDVAADSAAESTGGEPTNQDITNNQEDGVDEGGIVKSIGDHLVVLRQGRLYAVSVAEEGSPVQTGSIRVAPDEALNGGVWYDEMLVRGRDIYVVGYRYVTRVRDEADPEEIYWWIHGATEVSHFVLTSLGGLERGESLFFESADYYSGRNYASRMVDGRLLFYMPYYAFIHDRDGRGRSMRVPRFLNYAGEGEFTGGPPMFRGIDVFKPHRDPDYATFHTMVACDLDRGLKCRARSLVGDWSREFYVTRDRVYLWTHPWVVAFCLKTLTPTSHAVVGYPTDQFSFRESEGSLYIGVRVSGEVWPLEDVEDGEAGISRLAMLTLPLGEFNARGRQEIGEAHLTELLATTGWSWVRRNRHAEGWYVAAVESYGEESSSTLLAHHLDTGHTAAVGIDGLHVTRIEVMSGFGAMVATSTGRWGDGDMELMPLRLGPGDDLSFEPGLVLEGVREGESRSHGFFFRPNENGGTFGLPIMGNGEGWHWWGRGVSNIAFFDVDASACDLEAEDCEASPISHIGTISSSDESGGSCETSCVDWYGNTRPIFLGDRLFALMGSELAEAALTAGGVVPLGQPVIMTRD